MKLKQIISPLSLAVITALGANFVYANNNNADLNIPEMKFTDNSIEIGVNVENSFTMEELKKDELSIMNKRDLDAIDKDLAKLKSQEEISKSSLDKEFGTKTTDATGKTSKSLDEITTESLEKEFGAELKELEASHADISQVEASRQKALQQIEENHAQAQADLNQNFNKNFDKQLKELAEQAERNPEALQKQLEQIVGQNATAEENRAAKKEIERKVEDIVRENVGKSPEQILANLERDVKKTANATPLDLAIWERAGEMIKNNLNKLFKQPELSDYEKLSCEAILCLSSGTRPSECAPSINKYFSISFKHWGDTVKERRRFLDACPTQDEQAKDPVFADLMHKIKDIVEYDTTCDEQESLARINLNYSACSGRQNDARYKFGMFNYVGSNSSSGSSSSYSSKYSVITECKQTAFPRTVCNALWTHPYTYYFEGRGLPDWKCRKQMTKGAIAYNNALAAAEAQTHNTTLFTSSRSSARRYYNRLVKMGEAQFVQTLDRSVNWNEKVCVDAKWQ